MSWFKKLFKKVTTKKTSIYPINVTFNSGECKVFFLKRQKIEDIHYPSGIWRSDGNGGGPGVYLEQYQYWCECGTELTDGPTGGMAVCAVCKKCKVNFGADLPGYWGH